MLLEQERQRIRYQRHVHPLARELRRGTSNSEGLKAKAKWSASGRNVGTPSTSVSRSSGGSTDGPLQRDPQLDESEPVDRDGAPRGLAAQIEIDVGDDLQRMVQAGRRVMALGSTRVIQRLS